MISVPFGGETRAVRRTRGPVPSPTLALLALTLSMMLGAESASAAPCSNLLSASAPTPAGYGASFNLFSPSKEFLIAGTDCTAATAKIAVGSGSPDQYVFKNGYYWTGAQWKEVTLSGPTLISDTWYKGSATGTIPLGANPNYVLGYVCQRDGGRWKCGCSDESCGEERWQMQAMAGSGGSEEKAGLPADLIPFEQPPIATLKQSDKLVVAHWHQFPISRDKAGPEDDMYAGLMKSDSGIMGIRVRPLGRPARREADWKFADALIDIRWAQNIGVDAFLLNVAADLKNAWAWPMYTRYLTAAQHLGTGFKVAPNIDCVAPGNPRDMANTIVSRLKESGAFDSENQLRVGGKFVVGSFYANSCGVDYMKTFKSTLKTNGLDPFLVCVMLGGAYRAEFAGVCDAWSDWGRKDPWSAAGSDYSRRYAGAGADPIMAAISQGDVRYKKDKNIAYEQKGSETLRINWEEAITTSADWAQLVTWNDLGEHSEFYPNTGNQFAVYDLTAYYIAWFKTGKRPQINKDAVYYFHRIAKVPPAPELRNGSWSNEVEAVAFLTAPATVEIITADGTTRKDFPAGMNVLTAPMPDRGRPRFNIVRNGNVVADVTSAFPIGAMPAKNDVVYRSGGSLRSAYGASHDAESACRSADADGCLMEQGEPVWLAQ
jgi:hypothetical protein